MLLDVERFRALDQATQLFLIGGLLRLVEYPDMLASLRQSEQDRLLQIFRIVGLVNILGMFSVIGPRVVPLTTRAKDMDKRESSVLDCFDEDIVEMCLAAREATGYEGGTRSQCQRCGIQRRFYLAIRA